MDFSIHSAYGLCLLLLALSAPGIFENGICSYFLPVACQKQIVVGFKCGQFVAPLRLSARA